MRQLLNANKINRCQPSSNISATKPNHFWASTIRGLQGNACISRDPISSIESGHYPSGNNRVLVNLHRLHEHGRLGGTGYVSMLPVDQGIEHSAGASFAKDPDYFDPENIVRKSATPELWFAG
jgi:hypothetical protein